MRCILYYVTFFACVNVIVIANFVAHVQKYFTLLLLSSSAAAAALKFTKYGH
jgi:hypothetical protein